MREIECRGYSKEEMVDSQWLYGYGIEKIEYSNGDYDITLFTESGVYYVYEESAGQYTGLKDKNGKKIFEGDILGCKKLKFRTIEIGIVKFEQGCFICGADFLFSICNDYEVVGNIYEEGTIK